MPQVRCSYLLMCHTDPEGVLRLVRRIRDLSPEAGILVRHYRPGLFGNGEVEAAGGIRYQSDVPADWGDWSLVEMQLDAFRAARRLVPADRYAVLSGQDYPIRDLDSWERELEAEGADAVIEPMSAQPRDHEFRWRIRHEPDAGPVLPRRAVRALASRAAPLISRVVDVYPVTRDEKTRWWIGTPRRSAAPGPIVKASLWSVLSGTAVDAALAADRDDADGRAFFRTVRTPDEYYVPSLLAAARLRIAHRPVTFKQFGGGASPVWIDRDVLAAAARTPAAFVRKVGPDVDPTVLAEADRLADAGRPSAGRA